MITCTVVQAALGIPHLANSLLYGISLFNTGSCISTLQLPISSMDSFHQTQGKELLKAWYGCYTHSASLYTSVCHLQHSTKWFSLKSFLMMYYNGFIGGECLESDPCMFDFALSFVFVEVTTLHVSVINGLSGFFFFLLLFFWVVVQGVSATASNLD